MDDNNFNYGIKTNNWVKYVKYCRTNPDDPMGRFMTGYFSFLADEIIVKKNLIASFDTKERKGTFEIPPLSTEIPENQSRDTLANIEKFKFIYKINCWEYKADSCNVFNVACQKAMYAVTGDDINAIVLREAIKNNKKFTFPLEITMDPVVSSTDIAEYVKKQEEIVAHEENADIIRRINSINNNSCGADGYEFCCAIIEYLSNL